MKSVLTAHALVSFAFKTIVRTEDKISWSIPDLNSISLKPNISSSKRTSKVHVHNQFHEFNLPKKKIDAISRNILTVCRSTIRLHISCSLIMTYTGHKSNLITAKHYKSLE